MSEDPRSGRPLAIALTSIVLSYVEADPDVVWAEERIAALAEDMTPDDA